jgi:predicted TIM-barrel fold metal-dependent hydrolase
VAGAGLRAELDRIRLIDHHCHGVWPGRLSRAEFEEGISESADPPPPGTTSFDSQLGLAVRRWCAPVLGLPPHAAPAEYVGRRAELGAGEVNRRLLTAAGLGGLFVDTGYRSGELAAPDVLGELAGAPAAEIVRIETVAEQLLAAGAEPDDLVQSYPAALATAATDAVALKTVLAYRAGLDLAPERPPSGADVAAAARRRRHRGPSRLDDPVLLRFAIWSAVEVGRELGLPLQVHAGFGDPDLTLHRSDPSLLTGFLRATRPLGVPVVLLHNYPYHRQAAYLAHAFPHVYLDVGLAIHYAGAAAPTVLAEALELAPFAKLLYASDAFGLAELYYLGAVLFRRALDAVLSRLVDAGDWSRSDALRVARLVGAGNARRLYGRQRGEGHWSATHW